MSGSVLARFDEIGLEGQGTGDIERGVPLETPVALEFAGFAYAVMLATPHQLEDFVVGFALSEGLIESANELDQIDIAELEDGVIIRAQLPEDRAEPLRDRLRLRLSEGSCGLCGLRSIEEVLRPLPTLDRAPRASIAAVRLALQTMPPMQELSQSTGATHAAAFCDADGQIVAVREDIGRHNALDKLIGHCSREGIDMAAGFIVLTARCSYELVEKTVRAGCGLLVTISAPSSLAIDRAKQSGLSLVNLARSDTALVANDPHGIFL